MTMIGTHTLSVDKIDALTHARQRAALMPTLLIEARRIVHTIIPGWHGRRKYGMGENFWQLRPYIEGEALSLIDWRRSARDDHIYVREREWEAAHTVWLWADMSSSMLYKSYFATVSKETRALVIILALADLLSFTSESIAFPGVISPFSTRNGAERLAEALVHSTDNVSLPDIGNIKRFSDIILVSDFLHPVEDMLEFLKTLVKRDVRGHLIEISDPAEESFPYIGQVEFHDPETGEKITAGRAEKHAEDYRRLYLARREMLMDYCKRLGWSFIVHHTDRSASEALARIHMSMTANIKFRKDAI